MSPHLPEGHPSQTLVDLLRRRAQEPDQRDLYTFLDEQGEEVESWTAAVLDRRARAIAARLQEAGLPGERAVLMYAPGLEYLAAFFGCLYAGVTAAPAYPPSRARRCSRLQSIVADATPRAILSTSDLLATGEEAAGVSFTQGGVVGIATDQVDPAAADDWRQGDVRPDDLAFLQYTSGSTATPKGVMVSHANLLHNLEAIRQAFGHTPEDRGVIWLPPYHDMGLIGGLLQPLFAGMPVTLMAPMTFLRNPRVWLEAISRYRGTVSGGPNFAYELCLSRTTPEQRASLDLSCWKVAFNGAEPVQAATLERFAEAFAPAGFRHEAFFPCYGLAEATLFVSGGPGKLPPAVRSVSRPALEQNRAAPADESEESCVLVSSGRPGAGQQVIVVDPQSRTRCADGAIGEIWVAGPSSAQGYWARPADSVETFQARLADSDEGPFLRTGDLGFLAEGELYVTARQKDLIVIRGRNLYPQDIERTVQNSHPGLQAACGAAFSVPRGGEERLIVVQELQRTARHGNLEEIAEAVQSRVVQEHGVTPYEILLLKPGSVPRTSSGKIQRHACRDGYRNRTLPVLHARFAPAVKKRSIAAQTMPVAEVPRDEPSIQNELRHRLAELLGTPPEQIDGQKSLNSLGLDSLVAVEVKHYLEDRFRIGIDAGELIEGITLEAIARRILADAAPA
jgi:acyl-CoA synthetase (AMP-forming)/AMP-acid ligase II/acyl carrier protein